MATAELHVGDVGVPFQVTVTDDAGNPIDLSLSSVRTIKFEAPSGGVANRPATLVSGGSDGRMQYVTVAGDLFEAGTWKVQGYVEAGGLKVHTSVLKFKVLANLS